MLLTTYTRLSERLMSTAAHEPETEHDDRPQGEGEYNGRRVSMGEARRFDSREGEEGYLRVMSDSSTNGFAVKGGYSASVRLPRCMCNNLQSSCY
jgi:hypothetical protein